MRTLQNMLDTIPLAVISDKAEVKTVQLTGTMLAQVATGLLWQFDEVHVTSYHKAQADVDFSVLAVGMPVRMHDCIIGNPLFHGTRVTPEFVRMILDVNRTRYAIAPRIFPHALHKTAVRIQIATTVDVPLPHLPIVNQIAKVQNPMVCAGLDGVNLIYHRVHISDAYHSVDALLHPVMTRVFTKVGVGNGG